jgi:hypothetical protein
MARLGCCCYFVVGVLHHPGHDGSNSGGSMKHQPVLVGKVKGNTPKEDEDVK